MKLEGVMTVLKSDDGELVLEWIGTKQRIGFVIDKEGTSSYFIVKDSFSAGGELTKAQELGFREFISKSFDL